MTSLKIAVAAVLLAGLPVAALSQEPAAKPAPAAKVAAQAKAEPTLQARVFVLEHIRPVRLVDALKPLVSNGLGAMIVPNDATMSISVRDLPANLAAIESVIRLLDKPSSGAATKRPGPVDVHISVIAASMTAPTADAPAPAVLAPVMEQLKRTLSFKYYRYMTTFTQRMGADERAGTAKASGAIATPFPTGTAQDKPAAYSYQLKDVSGELADAGPATFFMDFRFSLVTTRVTNQAAVAAGTQTEQLESQPLLLETDGLSLKEGEQVVVGSSGAGNGDQSIIVVVSVKRAGA